MARPERLFQIPTGCRELQKSRVWSNITGSRGASEKSKLRVLLEYRRRFKFVLHSRQIMCEVGGLDPTTVAGHNPVET